MGEYSGTNRGLLVIDLDDHGSHFEGYAHAFDSNLAMPSSYVEIKTKNKDEKHSIEVDLIPVDPKTGFHMTRGQMAEIFPDAYLSLKANVDIAFEDQFLNVKWTTSLGTAGSGKIEKSKAGLPSEYQCEKSITTWKQFKDYVDTQPHRRFIFRGQKDRKRLRTGFHRSGRADVNRFADRDIVQLFKHLSQRMNHVFNFDIPDQRGAFYNLIQHHGYPTPLLDWSYSPYVSAFFAYRGVDPRPEIGSKADDKVRIFMFDQEQWKKDQFQFTSLHGLPHFSVLEFMAIGNERMVPQQSISTVTNIDDIENFINRAEKLKAKKYLTIIDLPLNERNHVMTDLSRMGITAGSMFPGMDGACEELKERFFNFMD